MDDFIICGICSSQFYLSNYQDFLNHKISKCNNFNGNNCKAFRDYYCFHCNYSSTNADAFIIHYEETHKLKLLRSSVDATTQIEEFEEIDLNVNDNKFRNFSLLADIAPVIDVPLSQMMVKRDRCCMEDPNGDYCDEMTQCPLLMETSAMSPATSRDTGINNTDDSFNSQSLINEFQLNMFQYSCHLCKKRFKQKVHLNKHVLVKHENSRPYKCSICNYCTIEKGYLKTHMRKHTGERPYSCMACDYQSSQNCALKVHMKRLHPDFMIDCQFCEQRFRTSLEHKKHEQVCRSKFGHENLH